MVLNISKSIISFNPQAVLCEKDYYYLRFTDEDIEATEIKQLA